MLLNVLFAYCLILQTTLYLSPNYRIDFTVSPVRQERSGLICTNNLTFQEQTCA